MASIQASSTIEYLSSDIIGQGFFVNTFASMNLFATSKVAFWSCWMCWSILALGCGVFWSPLHLMGSTSTRADGARSDSYTLLRRVDFWGLSSGGGIVAGGLPQFGSRGHAMTVSAWLRFFGSGTLLVRNDLSQPTWPRPQTTCWWSRSSSSMSDDKADSLVASLSSSLISWQLPLTWFIDEIGDFSDP